MADGFWYGVLIGWLVNTMALLMIVLLFRLFCRAAPATGTSVPNEGT